MKLYLGADRGLAGAPFGLPPTPRALDAYLELLDGTGLAWAVSAVGADVTSLDVCRAALDAGGHLHVGLEFFGGDRQPTNVELVEAAVKAAADAGRPVATCDDAAAILAPPPLTAAPPSECLPHRSVSCGKALHEALGCTSHSDGSSQ